MARKIWMWVSMLLNLVGGLQNVLLPALMAKPFGLTVDGSGLELLRFVGILQLGYATLSWAGLKVTSADGQRAVDLTLCVGYVLGVPYIIYEGVSHGVGVAAYLQGGAPLILAIAFGSFLLGRRTQAGDQVVKPSRAAR